MKKMFKAVINNPKWTVTKLKDETEVERYNQKVKLNLINTTTDGIHTNLHWENLKQAITTAAKETLGNLIQQTRKPWISEKTVALIEKRRKHKQDKNKDDY